jgi:hypothetical protein
MTPFQKGMLQCGREGILRAIEWIEANPEKLLCKGPVTTSGSI